MEMKIQILSEEKMTRKVLTTVLIGKDFCVFFRFCVCVCGGDPEQMQWKEREMET